MGASLPLAGNQVGIENAFEGTFRLGFGNAREVGLKISVEGAPFFDEEEVAEGAVGANFDRTVEIEHC